MKWRTSSFGYYLGRTKGRTTSDFLVFDVGIHTPVDERLQHLTNSLSVLNMMVSPLSSKLQSISKTCGLSTPASIAGLTIEALGLSLAASEFTIVLSNMTHLCFISSGTLHPASCASVNSNKRLAVFPLEFLVPRIQRCG